MHRTVSPHHEVVISERCRAIDVSGIRRVFELGAQLKDPINLSIGQPDFPVPDAIKEGAIAAIRNDVNGYTLTQGHPVLLERVQERIRRDIGWDCDADEMMAMVTSGTSGAILLACMALLDRGDEIVIPDPYFVAYPPHAALVGATVRYCDTYPDFRMTAERIEPLLTDRTRLVLVNSPANPSGVVLNEAEVKAIAELCEQRGVLLLSDEIYDEFTYPEAREHDRCPSPARYTQNCLLVRGFGKTYGCTGWRLGYAAGPRAIIQEMMKLQQYTFVCAPSMGQLGVAEAFNVDMAPTIARYQTRRDMVISAFADLTSVSVPGGAFYAFVEVPPRLGMTASEVVERAIAEQVLIIPGGVFSRRDTHFRLSFAAPEDRLGQGLAILRALLSK